MIVGVQSKDYFQVRGKVLPFLENFAQRSLGRWTVETLEAGIVGLERQIWSINDFQALGMTSIGPEDVTIEACAGIRRHDWQEQFDDEIKAWARHLGKKRVIAIVRPGWAAFGSKRNYKERHREMVCELNGG